MTIETFLTTGRTELELPVAPLSNYCNELASLSYMIWNKVLYFNNPEWDFKIIFYKKDSDLVLTGSLLYGNYKLTKNCG